jgi:hypothetical protein
MISSFQSLKILLNSMFHNFLKRFCNRPRSLHYVMMSLSSTNLTTTENNSIKNVRETQERILKPQIL